MINGETIEIMGNALLAGSDPVDSLVSGTLLLHGDFTQNANGNSFNVGPGFTVSFVGSATQNVSFTDPATSHFGNLRIDQPGSAGVNLTTEVNAVGDFTVPGDVTGWQNVIGNGNPLRVGGLDVDSLTLDHALFTWEGTGLFSGAYTRLGNVTFSDYPDSEIQFNIHHPGLVESGYVYTSNLTFLSPANPANGGYYMKAEDSDSTLVDTLIINTYFYSYNLPNEPAGYPDCLAADSKFLRAKGAMILFGCS
jgi:hypothetical protein